MEPRFVYVRVDSTAPFNNRSNRISHHILTHTMRFGFDGVPKMRFGAVVINRKTYGAIRCGSVLFHVLWCDSVRFLGIRKHAVWCGAVCRNRKTYGAVRCDFPISQKLRCGAVRLTAPNRTEPIGKPAPVKSARKCAHRVAYLRRSHARFCFRVFLLII